MWAKIKLEVRFVAEDDEGGWAGLARWGNSFKDADVSDAKTRENLKDYYDTLKERLDESDPDTEPGYISEIRNRYETLEEYGSHFDVDPAHFAAYAANIVCDIVGLLFSALKLTVSNTRQIVSDAAYSVRGSGKRYDDGTYSNGVKEGKQKGKRKDKTFEGNGKNSEKQENENEYKYSRQERAERIRRDKADIAKYEERRARRSRLLSSMEEEEERQQQSEMAMKR